MFAMTTTKIPAKRRNTTSMESPWVRYNMRRMQVGLDAWVDPLELSAMQEELDKDVIARTEPHMVKLIGLDLHGNAVQSASGFLYTTSAANIITCKHVRYYTPPNGVEQMEVHRFMARYAADGVQEEVHVLTQPHPLYDLMVLRGSRCATTDFMAAICVAGDVTYVAGFPPESTQVCFSKGMIGSMTPSSMIVNAHADNGWSGGPVVNRRGRLVGVMQQGLGATIKRPDAISATRLHDFLSMNNVPGLSE
ncbi:hypothetical protein CEUSTIGMA_g1272.t1 [Chlamydomonas eustigma]|uniref:Serine protease n=1 Tax=Chlamydomonas eustigma TaxID=1157962 RepID=A0A250WSP6_9CHLO|nr:hypothetical protein CEUSTIGMA_g1272.t1 [Chlamydomonas eustigma]|eukprot:GAX73821.1 hypothetical protein CEUSTIGMA_g1272.t1 [Chlamydomonas eustigma]